MVFLKGIGVNMEFKRWGKLLCMNVFRINMDGFEKLNLDVIMMFLVSSE